MAILFFSGFNLASAVTPLSMFGWAMSGLNPPTYGNTGRFGSRGVSIVGYSPASLSGNIRRNITMTSDFSISIVGKFKPGRDSSREATTLALAGSEASLSVTPLYMVVNDDFSVGVYHRGSKVITTAPWVILDTFQNIEITFKRGDALSGEIRLYIDNVLHGAYSGVTNTGVIPSLLFIGSGITTGTSVISDVAISDGERIGDFRTDLVVPSNDTSVEDFVPSSGSNGWAMVGENPTDGDTTYISTEIVGGRSEFEITPLPEAIATVKAAQLIAVARKTDAGSLGGVVTLNSNGSEVSSDTLYPPTSYVAGVFPVNLNPDGNVEWTTEAINAVKIGVEAVL